MESELAVLMTVYNGQEYLETAIDSILSQTFKNFHFLIVDDASSDNSKDLIRSFDDPRIELLELDQNVGQTAALNIGLRHITQPWVARMDADDYSAPTRFEKQMRAIQDNPLLSCVGTYSWMFYDDPSEVNGTIEHPQEHSEIRRLLLRGSPLVHSSMLAKRAALLEIGGYDERYRYSADVELYERLMDNFITANIPYLLYGIRRHPSQGTRTNVAQNETIEIFYNKLWSGKYSVEERSIISSSLARFNVVLAHQLMTQGRVFDMFKTLIKSLKYSPTTFLWYFPILFSSYSLPESKRMRLKIWLKGLRFSKW